MSKINIFEMYARNFPQDIKMVGNPVKPKTKSAVDICVRKHDIQNCQH